MKRLALCLLATIMMFVAGCDEFGGDMQIPQEVVEEQCAQMNSTISSLLSIVNAMQNNDYVESVDPIVEEDNTVGYTITFVKKGAIPLYKVSESVNVSTPNIAINKDSDGLYYWTLNGEWLLDGAGNRVIAQSVDGNVGVAPQLKADNGYWQVSYDGGKTWSELSEIVVEEGASKNPIFEDVVCDDNFVIIKFSDGSELVAPRFTSANIPKNQIWYTNAYGKMDPKNSGVDVFGANLISNKYETNVGIMTFDGDITMIGDEAFEGCLDLKTIMLPDGISSIGFEAFKACVELKSITIPNGVTSIGDSAFLGSGIESLALPETVTSIENYAFLRCEKLKSITIPESIVTIEDAAFAGCKSLSAIYGKYATADNRALIIDERLVAFAPLDLTSYTVPKGVKEIGGYAFYNCDKIESITIPKGVTSIGQFVFCYCSKLKQLEIPDGVVSIGDSAFYACSTLENITIPNSVTTIGVQAFAGCESLASVTLSNNLTSIERDMFSGCKSLNIVSIPDSVTKIDCFVFYRCSNLESVTISKGLTSIGKAFSECPKLTHIFCKPTDPPFVYNVDGIGIGSDNLGLKIYVPKQSVEAYKTSEDWSKYADIIEGYDF